jgi:cell division FtsZ-interacting protein ZapD
MCKKEVRVNIDHQRRKIASWLQKEGMDKNRERGGQIQ